MGTRSVSDDWRRRRARVSHELSVRRFLNHAGLSRLDVPSPQLGEGSLSFIRHRAIHSLYVCWQDEDQASIVVLPS